MTQGQLFNGFRKIWDSNYSLYTGVKSAEDCALQWKNIMFDYYSSMILPLPGMSNAMLQIGINQFYTSMLGIINARIVDKQLEQVLSNLHNAMIQGVNMTGLYTTVFIPLPSLKPYLNQNNATIICNNIATAINLWVHTTVSVQTSSGATILWS